METFSGKNGNSEKILTLKKCISKMDKLFHKSEKEYLKQIEKLRLDLDKKDKVAQVGFVVVAIGKQVYFRLRFNTMNSRIIHLVFTKVF